MLVLQAAAQTAGQSSKPEKVRKRMSLHKPLRIPFLGQFVSGMLGHPPPIPKAKQSTPGIDLMSTCRQKNSCYPPPEKHRNRPLPVHNRPLAYVVLKRSFGESVLKRMQFGNEIKGIAFLRHAAARPQVSAALPQQLPCRYSAEEYAVALLAEHSEDTVRSFEGVRLEGETFLAGAPVDERLGFDEVPFEVVLRIVQIHAADHVFPASVERNLGVDFVLIPKRMQEVPVVGNFEIVHRQRGATLMLADAHGILIDARDPEQTAGGDAGVVVVNLVIEVNLTVVEIQSDEREGAVAAVPAHGNVLPLHEADIGLEEQRSLFAGLGVRASAGPEDAAVADCTAKVGDLRRLDAGSNGREVMDEERFIPNDDGDAAGNGPGVVAVAG